jgi:putative Ca2+/H+ antiporter (TMEM165/GDT1 family)
MGAFVAREAIRHSGEPGALACELAEGSDCPPTRWDWKAFGSTLGLLFVAELGDKTQLAVLSLAGKHGDPWPVFAGGALALTLVTALGVVGGQGLCKVIPERLLLGVSAAAFVAMGILMGVGIL